MRSFLGVHGEREREALSSSSYTDTSYIRLEPHPIHSFNLNDLVIGPVLKYSHFGERASTHKLSPRTD